MRKRPRVEHLFHVNVAFGAVVAVGGRGYKKKELAYTYVHHPQRLLSLWNEWICSDRHGEDRRRIIEEARGWRHQSHRAKAAAARVGRRKTR